MFTVFLILWQRTQTAEERDEDQIGWILMNNRGPVSELVLFPTQVDNIS
jgi:hypothetical protein